MNGNTLKGCVSEFKIQGIFLYQGASTTHTLNIAKYGRKEKTEIYDHEVEVCWTFYFIPSASALPLSVT